MIRMLMVILMIMTATITNNYGDDQHADDNDEDESDEDVEDAAVNNDDGDNDMVETANMEDMIANKISMRSMV